MVGVGLVDRYADLRAKRQAATTIQPYFDCVVIGESLEAGGSRAGSSPVSHRVSPPLRKRVVVLSRYPRWSFALYSMSSPGHTPHENSLLLMMRVLS
jgi:hypothetical protein